MTDFVVMDRLVKVTIDGQDHRVAGSDLRLEDIDTATDQEIKTRAETALDIPEGTLTGHTVTRAENGNILIFPQATYG